MGRWEGRGRDREDARAICPTAISRVRTFRDLRGLRSSGAADRDRGGRRGAQSRHTSWRSQANADQTRRVGRCSIGGEISCNELNDRNGVAGAASHQNGSAHSHQTSRNTKTFHGNHPSKISKARSHPQSDWWQTHSPPAPKFTSGFGPKQLGTVFFSRFGALMTQKIYQNRNSCTRLPASPANAAPAPRHPVAGTRHQRPRARRLVEPAAPLQNPKGCREAPFFCWSRPAIHPSAAEGDSLPTSFMSRRRVADSAQTAETTQQRQGRFRGEITSSPRQSACSLRSSSPHPTIW